MDNLFLSSTNLEIMNILKLKKFSCIQAAKTFY